MKALNEYRIVRCANEFLIQRLVRRRRFWTPWRSFTQWRPLGRLHFLGGCPPVIWHEPKYYDTLADARAALDALLSPPALPEVVYSAKS